MPCRVQTSCPADIWGPSHRTLSWFIYLEPHNLITSSLFGIRGTNDLRFIRIRSVRCQESGTILYGFRDALGPVLGAIAQIKDVIHYQHGQWMLQVTEDESSRWRELPNCFVAFLKDLVEEGDYEGLSCLRPQKKKILMGR
jgi:hypothetical protein